MKNRIKLTESQLNRVIRESVKQTLSELDSAGASFNPDERFDFCGNFYEGFAIVKLNGKWNYINTSEELLSPNQWFDDCYEFYNGLARVELNGEWNFIDANGDYLSDTWFDDCWGFNDGFARVKLGERWYEIDTKGQLYTENGDPVNSSLQENRRYKKNKKHIIRITESQLRNAINTAIKQL